MKAQQGISIAKTLEKSFNSVFKKLILRRQQISLTSVVFVLLHMKMQVYFNSGFKQKGLISMSIQTHKNVSKISGIPSYTQNKTRMNQYLSLIIF